ncbi:O-glycosyl hydrolase family 30 protein [Aphelenchoides avenae]|nr:O-glycosyl hydrolase family 30 protein [Aphelenchus avenae]
MARIPRGIVCVCNATYCDDFPPLGQLKKSQIAVFTTSRSGKRFNRTTIDFGKELPDADSSNKIRLKVDASKTYQEVFGFGGAFTDSAGIQLRRLSARARKHLLKTYYGNNGIEYSVGRVPMASTDFSTHEYSYLDEPGDFDLLNFKLAKEDFDLKIPYILAAINFTHGELKLFASPWSAPAWMKTNGHMKGGGQLKGEFNGPYYETYSKYFIKFFEEYFKHGIKFWGVTVQNEPRNNTDYDWQTMWLSPQMQRDFVNKLLGPAIRGSAVTRSLKIMAHDDLRDFLEEYAKEYFNESAGAKNYIDGLGIHWYPSVSYAISPFEPLERVHDANPSKFLFSTEACNAYERSEHAPILGDWLRGENYGHDIIQSLQRWVTGWTDWNIALDEHGGPNWVKNNVDAPIIVNNTRDEFYKQPMFYYMGHFRQSPVEQISTE